MGIPAPAPSTVRPPIPTVSRLRDLAIQALSRMYRPGQGLFAFRLRRAGDTLILEGSSRRYTAIALIGLAGEDEAVQGSVLAGIGAREACARLVREVEALENLGDVALVLWAASATGHGERASLVERLLALEPATAAHATVEVAWALAALCADTDDPAPALRHALARRLIASFEPRSGMFPHRQDERARGMREHVCCFADLVYPVHALALHAALSGDAEAREVAVRCASTICRRQGPQGQWWWHYDRRSGSVVEKYPVYAVHQDAMAPLALFAVERAAGVDLSSSLRAGLAWLAHAPELQGGTLVDTGAGLIWRKVARREPAKLSRYVQAAASRLHPAFRLTPALDALFPACVIDHEDRPYHLGWLLHAWPATRAARWDDGATPNIPVAVREMPL
jgi:hypothetical protein